MHAARVSDPQQATPRGEKPPAALATRAPERYLHAVTSRPIGPTERALSELSLRYRKSWQRIARGGLWRELALRRHFRLRVPRTRAAAGTGVRPDCPNCPNLCCQGAENQVSLRLRDIARLMDVGRTDLIQRRKRRFSPVAIAARPHLAALEASILWRRLPVLRQVGPDQRCAALTPDRRCGLYPAWPHSCARFPARLQPGGAIDWAPRCPTPAGTTGAVEVYAALRAAAQAAYRARIEDAVLLFHAPAQLDALGIGRFLIGAREDPFLAPPRAASRLTVLDSPACAEMRQAPPPA